MKNPRRHWTHQPLLSPELFAQVLRAFRRHRRMWVGLVCAGLALGVAQIVVPIVSPGTPVLVAARPMDAGASVSERDVTVVKVAHSAVPQNAVATFDQLPSGVLRSAVPRGLPLTRTAIESDAVTIPSGRALTSVPLVDAQLAPLATDGARVRLSCAGRESGRPTSIDGTARPRARAHDAPTSPGALSGPAEATLIVEIDATELSTVADCTQQGSLKVAIIG